MLLTKALEVYRDMAAGNKVPTGEEYNVLVHVLAQRGHIRKALHVFTNMKVWGCRAASYWGSGLMVCVLCYGCSGACCIACAV